MFWMHRSRKMQVRPAHQVPLGHAGVPGWQFLRRTWLGNPRGFQQGCGLSPRRCGKEKTKASCRLSHAAQTVLQLCNAAQMTPPWEDPLAWPVEHPMPVSVSFCVSLSECFPLSWAHLFHMLQLGTLNKIRWIVLCLTGYFFCVKPASPLRLQTTDQKAFKITPCVFGDVVSFKRRGKRKRE